MGLVFIEAVCQVLCALFLELCRLAYPCSWETPVCSTGYTLHRLVHLGGDTNDTASRSSAGIASLLGLLVAASAEIVSAGVDDDGAPDDAVLANQLDLRVTNAPLSVPLRVGLEVAQVSNVADMIRGGAVRLLEWVEVGTSRGAAIGVVAELVDVHSSLGIGVVAADIVGDGGG